MRTGLMPENIGNFVKVARASTTSAACDSGGGEGWTIYVFFDLLLENDKPSSNL